MDVNINPELLKWAVDTSLNPLSTIASRIMTHVSYGELLDWIYSDKSVPIPSDVLKAFSEATGVPYGMLLLDKPPGFLLGPNRSSRYMTQAYHSASAVMNQRYKGYEIDDKAAALATMIIEYFYKCDEEAKQDE